MSDDLSCAPPMPEAEAARERAFRIRLRRVARVLKHGIPMELPDGMLSVLALAVIDTADREVFPWEEE